MMCTGFLFLIGMGIGSLVLSLLWLVLGGNLPRATLVAVFVLVVLGFGGWVATMGTQECSAAFLTISDPE